MIYITFQFVIFLNQETLWSTINTGGFMKITKIV